MLVHLDSVQDAAPPSSSSDAGDAVAPRANACDETSLERPTQHGGGSDTVELVFSDLTLDDDEADAGAPLCPTPGFQLERQSCDAMTSTCRAACGASAEAGRAADNAAGALFREVRALPGARDLGLLAPTPALETGSANLLVRIRNYNGRADDDEVDLEFFGLVGLVADARPLSPAGLDGGFSGIDAGPWTRAWDRRSYREWSVDTATLDELVGLSTKFRGKGFVAGHVLRASVTKMPMAFSRFTVILDAVTFTGELRKESGGWTMVYGRLGGDIPMKELASRFPSFAANDPTLCQTVVQPLFNRACAVRDRGAPAAPACDALSLGASFAMVEGTLGLPRVVQSQSADCGVLQCPD